MTPSISIIIIARLHACYWPIGLHAWELQSAVNTPAKIASILDLVSVLGGSADDRIAWFQQKGLLASSLNCPACGSTMAMQTKNDVEDKRR